MKDDFVLSEKKIMFIIVGPSGAGKSSLASKSLEEFSQLEDTITCTTRKIRLNEAEGQPYYFLSRESFEQKQKENFFIEYSEVHGNLYGTPREQIKKAWDNNKAIIMDVDINGAISFKSMYKQAISIFILPPSIDALRQRLLKRDGARIEAEDLKTRLTNAKREIAMAKQFDHQIVNTDFETSYLQLKKIIEESLKTG